MIKGHTFDWLNTTQSAKLVITTISILYGKRKEGNLKYKYTTIL